MLGFFGFVLVLSTYYAVRDAAVLASHGSTATVVVTHGAYGPHTVFVGGRSEIHEHVPVTTHLFGALGFAAVEP